MIARFSELHVTSFIIDLLQGLIEASKSCAPELALERNPVGQWSEGVKVRAIEGRAPILSLRQQTGAFEHRNVLRDGGLRDIHQRRQRSHAPFSSDQFLEHEAPRR